MSVAVFEGLETPHLLPFPQLEKQPLNYACASKKDQSAPPPRNGGAVVVFSKINISTHFSSLPRSVCVAAEANVRIIKVAMHRLWRGVDWQFLL